MPDWRITPFFFLRRPCLPDGRQIRNRPPTDHKASAASVLSSEPKEPSMTKSCTAKRFFTFYAALLATLVLSPAARAENYPCTGDPAQLWTLSGYGDYSTFGFIDFPQLYPGASENPSASGNHVWIDYNTGTIPKSALGGLSNTFAVDVEHSILELVNGKVVKQLTGGLGFDISKVHDNTVIMHGGKISGDGVWHVIADGLRAYFPRLPG
jgi:hypothetical protein